MADYDIIIKGGTVVDGTRTPRYVSDIAIKDGKIAQIGGLKGKTAERVLEREPHRDEQRAAPIVGARGVVRMVEQGAEDRLGEIVAERPATPAATAA